MQSAIGKFIDETKLSSNEHKSVFYRLTNSKDEEGFLSLLNTNKQVQVYDEIHGQVEELIKCRDPKTVHTKESLHNAANEFFKNTDKDKYGVWVFYPWS